jgi:uncharacterized membrane protein
MTIGNHKFIFTLCHRMPNRSFFWKGKQFPVCARCTGIHIGYITYPLFLLDIWTLNLTITLLLIIPTCIDGITQAFFQRESNNSLRLVTGIISGVGLMSLVALIGEAIGRYILLFL